MKKVLSLVVAALFVSSAAFAANVNFTATATFAGAASFNFQLKNVSNDQNASNLVWGEDAFIMGEDTQWIMALQYAEVTANITKAGANVYMYTNNKVDSGISGLQPSTWKDDQNVSHDSFGGLVRTAGQGEPKGGDYRGYIPVMFSYNTTLNKTITCDGNQVIVGGGDTGLPVTRADRFLADKGTPNMDEYKDATIASLNGPTFGVDASTGAWPGACTDGKAYMFFFGGFKQVIGGDTYTTTIHVVEDFE